MSDPKGEKEFLIPKLNQRQFLRTYLNNIREWHGYIRFLGLPDRRDNPDILIDRLFVEPILSKRYLLPEEVSKRKLNETQTIFEVLKENRMTILLGDPGSGKSTLSNYLVWLLARPNLEMWNKKIGGWLLPVPMVLRELSLDTVTSFEDLLGAFLKHPMSFPLRQRKYLHSALEQGKALILLDGIDEVGDAESRERLRSCVLQGVSLFPNCKWILTSRIVGYDEVPFDRFGEKETIDAKEGRAKSSKERSLEYGLEQDIFDRLEAISEKQEMRHYNGVARRYIVPFDDKRIDLFARNWYSQREAAASRAGESARKLVKAIHEDPAILILARIPNLLTLMALIHRIEATLPHGRALLYERISEAYLESIDKFRGVFSGAFSLAQKRQWLARVGFELQQRRAVKPRRQGRRTRSRIQSEELQVLVEKADVISWIEDEIDKADQSASTMSASEFLDIVGRRSGLFLPRGEGRYAFVHLSFQEYFAAVAMEREVSSLDWARGTKTRLGLKWDSVRRFATQSVWLETYTFLFELLASKMDWHKNLIELIFGKRFSFLMKTNHSVDSGDKMNLSRLLIRLINNPLSGLRDEHKRLAVGSVVESALGNESEKWGEANEIFRDLFRDNDEANFNFLAVICAVAARNQYTKLDLSYTKVSSIQPIASVGNLSTLDLEATKVSDLRPLADLVRLERLDLSSADVEDIKPLESVESLKYLYLSDTNVNDLTPLAGLVNLEILSLADTPIVDLIALARLTSLRWLNLDRTRIFDLSPIARLHRLETCRLSDTEVHSIESLRNLSSLTVLDLDGTKVSKLGPLSNLVKLRMLYLRGCPIDDLGPIAEFEMLETLSLWDTRVVNLEPLKGLGCLEDLDLDGTQIEDIDPILQLSELRRVDLNNVEGSERMAMQIQEALPKCEVIV